MRKHALPLTMTWPLAKLVRDPVTFAPETDKKGRPIWDMPKPIGQHPVIQIVKEPVEEKQPDDTIQVKMVKKRKAVLIPIYRGVSAEMLRYAKSQAKRRQRIETERRVKRLLAEAMEPILEINEAIGEEDAPTEA